MIFVSLMVNGWLHREKQYFNVHFFLCALSQSFLNCLLFVVGNPMGRVEKAAVVKYGYHHNMVDHSQCYMVAHTLSSKPPSQKRELTEVTSSKIKLARTQAVLPALPLCADGSLVVHVCFVVIQG